MGANLGLFKSTATAVMRPETCRNWALDNAFNFYATTNSTECWGGFRSVAPALTDAPASACSKPCGGDSTRACGGGQGVYSLYSIISEPAGVPDGRGARGARAALVPGGAFRF